MSSLDLDREHKGSLYARAGVSDYWIVNLVDWQVEIYRRPEVEPMAPFGWQYAERSVRGAADVISPLVAPAARIAVADLLP